MRIAAWIPGVAGLGIGVLVVAGAHVAMGGRIATFVQPEAIAVVFGGTLAALLVSFSPRAIGNAMAGIRHLGTQPPMQLEALVPAFISYAKKARRQGIMAVEREIDGLNDKFLVRALTLSISGVPVQVVREALDIDARVYAEQEEEQAQVLEAAAGYAPTLGIVGAVLGLMRVMQHFSSSADMGAGIAAAFVATVYGVGAANLVFLPLATRLRGRARMDALRRELVIDGVLGLRDGASPGVLEERLSGYLSLTRASQQAAEVA